MSVEREGRPTFHMTKRARAGEHSLLWSDLPDHADCCFRVARVAGAADALDPTSLPLAAYSEPTCYSSCTCMGGDAGGGDDEGGGSCFSCALMGAVLGSVLRRCRTDEAGGALRRRGARSGEKRSYGKISQTDTAQVRGAE